MSEPVTIFGIFGHHPARSTAAGQIHIRDAAILDDLRARVSGVAARDNATRGTGWTIDFSPVTIDTTTERSIVEAVLRSERRGERRLAIAIARDWVQVDHGGVGDSAARADSKRIAQILAEAVRRAADASAEESSGSRPVQAAEPRP